jgi:hypothetical protein
VYLKEKDELLGVLKHGNPVLYSRAMEQIKGE